MGWKGKVMRVARMCIGCAYRQWFPFLLIVAGSGTLIGGWIGSSFGVFYLFRDEPPIRDVLAVAVVLRSSMFKSFVFLSILAGFVFLFDFNRERTGQSAPHDMKPEASTSRLSVFAGLYLGFLPLALLPLLATMLPALAPAPSLTRAEYIRAAAGTCAGLAALLPWFWIHALPRSSGPKARPIDRVLRSPRMRNLFLLASMAMVAVLFVPEYPSSSLIHLAIIVLALYMALVLLPPLRPLLIATILLAGLGSDLKHAVPGLTASTAQAVAGSSSNPERRPVDPVDALDKWAKSRASPPAKPKLAILSVSGGGYASAFWTAVVLDGMRSQAPQVLKDVRLLTGASGGMVAAAYFALQEAGGIPAGSLVEAMKNDVARSELNRGTDLARGYSGASIDSLSAVARQLVPWDLLAHFWPGRPAVDRGTMLERQWLSLRRPFGTLAEAESAGKAPALLLAPVLVETGQPLIISNLDLGGAPAPAGAETPAGTAAPDLFGRAEKLFLRYPDAAVSLTLATAVRLNATFPFILPAASLPGIPRRRVMDAGFFDNYGIALAAEYLRLPSVREWITKYTSGVAIIQVRAFPSDPEGITFADPECQIPTSTGSKWARALLGGSDWLVAPFEGLLAAREEGMVARNEQLMRLLMADYSHSIPIDSILFENTARVSLSWYLTDGELQCMRKEWQRNPGNRSAVENLIRFWKS